MPSPLLKYKKSGASKSLATYRSTNPSLFKSDATTLLGNPVRLRPASSVTSIKLFEPVFLNNCKEYSGSVKSEPKNFE